MLAGKLKKTPKKQLYRDFDNPSKSLKHLVIIFSYNWRNCKARFNGFDPCKYYKMTAQKEFEKVRREEIFYIELITNRRFAQKISCQRQNA